MAYQYKGQKITKLTVQFNLQKIIKQTKTVQAEVTEGDWKTDDSGKTTMDAKKLTEKAIKMGYENNDGWEEEDVEIVLHPIQKPE